MTNKQICEEKKKIINNLKIQGHINPINEANRIINIKYGKGWREENNIKTNNVGTVSHYYK